ncbi:Glycosyltransferase, GT2 family [Marivirga sericea]|uniref:Glycosyltransferase, GT2 family n=1 Tax=Marivirga sericea TaxID=1028 RepID=A0A1X7L9W1_9BACT|nr:glycosyltransferase [Marivirga sericea]SMG50535.1 Glycosyltransferase, GT2 family [Marivirga sericea]
MLDNFKSHCSQKENSPVFSIVIPTWNNLNILKNCIKAIRNHSELNHQIIVFINEGKDDTLEWVKQQEDLDYVFSPENVGICYALNSCRKLFQADYMLYLNDDMYVLPNWDKVLHDEIRSLDTKMFMLSATLIEPTDTGNSCVVVKDYGNGLDNFQEEKLLSEYKSLVKNDWSGSTWPPNIMAVDLWDLVGGLSIEYSPGMYSDPDFSKKIYEAGVKIFKGKGESLVYHFGSKSTKRLGKNTGRIQFIMKWGLSSKTFTQNFLKIGADYSSIIKETNLPQSKKIVNRLKKIYYSFK